MVEEPRHDALEGVVARQSGRQGLLAALAVLLHLLGALEARLRLGDQLEEHGGRLGGDDSRHLRTDVLLVVQHLIHVVLHGDEERLAGGDPHQNGGEGGHECQARGLDFHALRTNALGEGFVEIGHQANELGRGDEERLLGQQDGDVGHDAVDFLVLDTAGENTPTVSDLLSLEYSDRKESRFCTKKGWSSRTKPARMSKHRTTMLGGYLDEAILMHCSTC